MRRILAERQFPVSGLRLFSSARSAGRELQWQGAPVSVEDAATAEISRTQLWQWIRHGATLEDGRVVTTELFRAVLAEELEKIAALVGEAAFSAGRFPTARALFERLIVAPEFTDFLTLPAYDALLNPAESNLSRTTEEQP